MRVNKKITKGNNTMIKVKLSQYANTWDFIYKNKILGQIEKSDAPKVAGKNDYHMSVYQECGFERFDVWLGFTEAKKILLNELEEIISKENFDIKNYPNIKNYYEGKA